jgi:hypothetical protein
VHLLTPYSLRDRDNDELSTLALGFPAEDPSLFAVFISFLATGDLRHPNLRSATAPEHFFRFLIELFGLANHFKATTLRNAVLDRFFLRIYTQPNQLPMQNIHDVYKHSSEGSSLRDMVITTILNIGTGELVNKYCDELPGKFMADLLQTVEDEGVMPFGHKKEEGEARAWLEAKKGRVCGEYHLHDGEEEGAEEQDDGGGDGHYGDDGGDERDDGLDEEEDKYYDDGGEDEELRNFSERTRRELGPLYAIRARYTRY